MVIKLVRVFMVCQCNVYVISKSLGRKDLGYKSYTRAIWSKYLADSGDLLRIRERRTIVYMLTLQESLTERREVWIRESTPISLP